MKNLSKLLKRVGAFVALALLTLGFVVLWVGGEFRALSVGFAGTCRAIALGGSSEDVQIDRERGIAYLSLLDRDTLARGEPVDGTVMLLDLNLADPAPRAALTFDPQGFRPHGLSLLAQPSQPARLFAISHRADGVQTVEVAEQGSDGAFFPKETLRDPAFVHPNAIAATGARQFYLANDSTESGAWARMKEIVFGSGSATLVYYDGAKARVEASGLDYVAGLARSPDGSKLYVAETLADALRIYRRDAASGALTLEEVVDLDTAPDNLNVDADGVVWIAAHPKLLRFVGHLRNPAARAPTQVLRFDPRKSGDARIEQVYLDRGDEISAGTVAARWRDEFLIGALLEKKALLCKPEP